MFEHEKECLKLISSGDKTAYKELFDYYYPKTLVFLTKLLSSEPEAETEASDLAEDIFVRVWLMRGFIPEINSFSGYLYRMTRNAAFTYLKKKRADVSLEDIDIAEEAAIEEACEAKEKQMQINRIVEKMPRQRKKVYVLSRIDGPFH
jgi:RNA polymerase sigma-70 factor (ECF subfamily)